MNKFIGMAIGAVALASALPAAAVVTTFATFSPISSINNVSFVNSGTGAGRTTDANFTTISTGQGTTPGPTVVEFSFLQPEFGNSVRNVLANYSFAEQFGVGTPSIGSPVFDQNGGPGSFSFISTSAVTVNGRTFAAGANLLSGTFTLARLTGTFGGTAGSNFASTQGGSTIVYTSDFLDFRNTIFRDFAMSITSANPVFSPGANGAIGSFRALVGGQFSSEPAPLLTAVPEPETWAMMILGFSLVGVAARRRKTTVVSA